MPAKITDIKVRVKNLLRDEYDSSGHPKQLTSSDIHTGWWDAGKGNPQISVTNDEESPFDGGRTGYAGYRGDGSGPIQHRQGTVLVNCWAGTRDDYSERGLEQKQANEMRNEVERIIFNNATAIDELDSLSVISAEKVVETDDTPSMHRVQIEVQYTYIRTPN